MNHICGRSPVRTRGATELKWQRVRSQMTVKWKVKSGTKQTSHRQSRFPRECLERRGPCIALSNPPGSRNGHGFCVHKGLKGVISKCVQARVRMLL